MTEAVRCCAWIPLFSVFFASGVAVGQEDPEITLLHWINMRGVHAIETLQEQWGQSESNQRLVEDILELERRRVAVFGVTEISLLDFQALRQELDRLAEQFNHLMELYDVAIATHSTPETRRLKAELHFVIEKAILTIDLATKHPTLLTRSLIKPEKRFASYRFIGVIFRLIDRFIFTFSSDGNFRYFLSKVTLSGKTPVQRLREFLTIYFRLNQTHFESFWEPATSQASFTRHALDVLFAPCQR